MQTTSGWSLVSGASRGFQGKARTPNDGGRDMLYVSGSLGVLVAQCCRGLCMSSSGALV